MKVSIGRDRPDRRLLIGFLVNPIAGMGGAVGLKGTDGDLVYEALRRGARPVTPAKAIRFLRELRSLGLKSRILSAGGVMGCNYLESVGGLSYECLDTPPPHVRKTTRGDTVTAVKRMLSASTDVIVFVGGDGTARDVGSVTDGIIPILGVPSGVKMYSGVFATSPEAAAHIIKALEDGSGEVVITESVVADVDEEGLKEGVIRVRRYMNVETLRLNGLTVTTKDFASSGSYEEKYAVAKYFVEEYLRKDKLYLLGPGSTVKAITDVLGLGKTLLGVDALYNGRIIAMDLSCYDIMDLIRKFKEAYIVVTVIGGQGYVFGRGNQQFTPEIIRSVGKDHIVIIATKSKLAKLRYLLVDTGDPKLDRELSGYVRVLVGYREERVVRLLPASDPTVLRSSGAAASSKPPV